MRKQQIIVASAAALTLLLAGCSSPAPESSEAPEGGGSEIALPANIEEKGAIDVGVYFNYPPYTFEEDGELKGIEADLMRAVGEKLGVEVEFHDLAFEAMIPAVVNGRMDALIGPMGDTEERRKEVSFIDTLTAGFQAVVKKGNPSGFDIENPCGAKGGEVAASNNLEVMKLLSEECVKNGEAPISELSLPDAGNVFQAVISERTDFTLQVPALAQFMTETTPELELQGEPFPSPISDVQGWIVGKDNTELIDAIYTAINELIEDGTWTDIMEEAGQLEVALLPPLVNGEEYEVK